MPGDPWNGKCSVDLMRARTKENHMSGYVPSLDSAFLLPPEHISRSRDGNTGSCSVVAQTACVSAPILHKVQVPRSRFLVGKCSRNPGLLVRTWSKRPHLLLFLEWQDLVSRWDVREPPIAPVVCPANQPEGGWAQSLVVGNTGWACLLLSCVALSKPLNLSVSSSLK